MERNFSSTVKACSRDWCCQGFYPDGIYTAPTEEALAKDVELSMAAGFNGARLHQKVFEPLSYITATKQATWYGASRAVGDWITAIPQH